MSLHQKRLLACVFSGVLFVSIASATTYNGTPSTYASLLPGLKAGDTLNLASGTYPHLVVSGLSGTASAWITITGPVTDAPAVIQGATCCNTVEILNSSFVAIKNLQIDSLGIAGVFGVSAKGGTGNLVHDILLEGNALVGQGASQQTDAISTKTPTWGWVIRRNTITGAGTGLYLGNSDGTDPFIGGLIENNLIQNTIGYNAEIKFQIPRTNVPGMPTGQSVTIIRNNVFIKNDAASPDGNRPNLLVGGFPTSGAGSTDWYEVYGNLFIHNPREALFQASGRVTIHDNVFVDGQYTALRLQNQDLPLQIAYVYNNTIYSSHVGISFGNSASVDDAVTANLVFAATPISGLIAHSSDNMVDTLANAILYVTAPSFWPGVMNFYPLTGKCQGTAIDLSKFAFDTDSSIDFNGTSKTSATGTVAFRGAYAGQGINPGWVLQDGIKPLSSGPVAPSSLQCSPSTLTSGTQASCEVFLTVAATTNQVVTLSSNNPALTIPASITIPPGAVSGTFTSIAGTVSATQTATLTVSLNGFSVTNTLTVEPLSSRIGIFRPSAPVGGALGFFTLDSNGNYTFDVTDKTRQFGLAGDYPVAGDWDGNGTIKLGVFRCPAPGAGVCTWYLDDNNNGVWDGTFGGDVAFQFGLPGDIPVVGDWTGTGVSKVGVMRCPAAGQPGVCTWILDAQNLRAPNGNFLVSSYGLAGDLPAVGNWAGVGGSKPIDNIGVFRNGQWILNSSGVGGSKPIDNIGVFRNGQWILNSSGSGFWTPTDTQYSYGMPGDVPVTGNWLGSATKRIGVFRCPTGAPGSAMCQWILNTNGSGSFSATDLITSYGLVGDKPVVGFWTIP